MELIPLVDRWSKRAASRGTIGPVRPLVLDDPSPTARSIDDEWLLGKDILVAPVLEEGATSRDVYLPEGARWQRVVVAGDGQLAPRGKALAGGRTVSAAAPLSDIPIYVRASRSGGSDDRGGGNCGRGGDAGRPDGFRHGGHFSLGD